MRDARAASDTIINLDGENTRRNDLFEINYQLVINWEIADGFVAFDLRG